MKAKYSFRDTKGILWVACSECNRGANGKDQDKCCCPGSQSKRFNGLGCFLGKLVDRKEVK